MGLIACAAASAVMSAAAEAERINAEIEKLPESERMARREFYARRAHERRMESIARAQADAARDRSTGFLPFIFGMIIGGGGK